MVTKGPSELIRKFKHGALKAKTNKKRVRGRLLNINSICVIEDISLTSRDVLILGRKHPKDVGDFPHDLEDIPYQMGTSTCCFPILGHGETYGVCLHASLVQSNSFGH
jgi:hypothetical protein